MTMIAEVLTENGFRRAGISESLRIGVNMLFRRWNMLLLSSFVVLIPSVTLAQTNQSQTQSVCSPNLNGSDNNSVTVEGDCSQTIINNIYNGPVYNSISNAQQSAGHVRAVSETANVTKVPPESGALVIERPVARDLDNLESSGRLQIIRPEPRPLY